MGKKRKPLRLNDFYEKIILYHVVNCVYLYHQQPCILEERALWARRLSLGCRRILILTRTSPLGPWRCWHPTPYLTINETSLIWSKCSNEHKSYLWMFLLGATNSLKVWFWFFYFWGPRELNSLLQTQILEVVWGHTVKYNTSRVWKVYKLLNGAG